jgi:hypothetical protein
MIDDTVNTCIWSAVEPNVAVVGACLPMMVPIFHRVDRKSYGSTGKASGGSGNRNRNSDARWNHIRLEENQTGAPQQHWPVPPPGSKGFGQGAYVKTYEIPLTSHREWADKGSDNDMRDPSKSDIEMQRHGAPGGPQTSEEMMIKCCFPSIQETECLPSIQETEWKMRIQALQKNPVTGEQALR